MNNMEEERKRDRLVDRLKHGLVEFRGLEYNFKNLNLVDTVPCRQVDRVRRQFVFPDYLADLSHEEFLDPLRGLGMRVNLVLRNHAIYLGLFRVGKHFSSRGWLNHKKSDQLEVFETADRVKQRGGFASGEQAINTSLLLYRDHRL